MGILICVLNGTGKNTLRRMVEELVFLRPLGNWTVTVATNHPGAYDDLCSRKDQLSLNGELSVLLFDPGRAMIMLHSPGERRTPPAPAVLKPSPPGPAAPGKQRNVLYSARTGRMRLNPRAFNPSPIRTKRLIA